MQGSLNVIQIDFFGPTSIQNYLTKVARQDQGHTQDVMKQLKAWPGLGKGVVHMGQNK